MRSVALIAAVMAAGLSTAAAAAPTDAEAVKDPATGRTENQTDFKGLKLGVGLSLTLDTGSNDRVDDAEVVGGLVRVKDEENARARIMLESHYFFLPQRSFLGVSANDWGIGPFVAIQPGENDIVQAAGAGLMIGFRRPDSSSSWNIGVGLVYDPNTKTLGDGIVANQPLPPGETTVRYKERAQKGVVILTSFSF